MRQIGVSRSNIVILGFSVVGIAVMISSATFAAQAPNSASQEDNSAAQEIFARSHHIASQGDTKGALELVKRAKGLTSSDSQENDALSAAPKRKWSRLLFPWSKKSRSESESLPKDESEGNPFRSTRNPTASDSNVLRNRADQTQAETNFRETRPQTPSAPRSTAAKAPKPLLERIEEEMAEAAPAERQEMYEYLRTVDPSMVGPILKTWRMARRMGHSPLGISNDSNAAVQRRPETTPASDDIRKRQDSGVALTGFGYTGLKAPDPRRTGSHHGLGSVQPWGTGSDIDSAETHSTSGFDEQQSYRTRMMARTQNRSAVSADQTTTTPGMEIVPVSGGDSRTEIPAIQAPLNASNAGNPIQLGFGTSSEAASQAPPINRTPATAQPALSSTDMAEDRVGSGSLPPQNLASPSNQTSQTQPEPADLSLAAPNVTQTVVQKPAPSVPPAASVGPAIGAPSVGPASQQAPPIASAPQTSNNVQTPESRESAVPGWDGLRNVIHNAGQGLQTSLTGARLGLDFRKPLKANDLPAPANPPDQNVLTDTQPQDALLQQLIALTESRLAQASTDSAESGDMVQRIEDHVHLRMLYLVAGQHERALEAIPVIDPADQEFWQQMFWAMSNYFDTKGIPDRSDRASQTVAQLKTAVNRLEENARLELRNVNFCHKITSYGNYSKFDRDEFAPGQPALVYAEVENFKSEPASDGQYRTVLKSTVEFYKAGPNGDLVDQIAFPSTVDLCRNHRRDYFHSYEIAIPQKISLGPHVLKLTVEDELSQKIATYSVNFVVK